MMTTEKRILIASILSALVLLMYSKGAEPPTKQNSAYKPTARIQDKQAAQIPDLSTLKEETITLESSHLRLEVGASSAAIRSATLKNYKSDQPEQQFLKFGARYPVILLSRYRDKPMVLKAHSSTSATWASEIDKNEAEVVSIRLLDDSPVLRIEQSVTRVAAPPTLVATWTRGDSVSGSGNMLEATLKTDKSAPWQRQYLRYFDGSAKHVVPRRTEQATLSERFFCLSIKTNHPMIAETIPFGHGTIGVSIKQEPSKATSESYDIYIGPRDYFIMRNSEFEHAFQVGILANIGLALVLFLKGIASIVKNYGVAIILLSIAVTLFLSPFTLLSYRSMKKMQELQPKLDQLKAKYQDDQKKMNQMMMELFREHKVSPMSGCLPMMFQLPVFFALWSAISHVIELRGQRFLWISDLSMPDRLARLPFGELNALPILMTIAMYVQSKITQKSVGSAKSQAVVSAPIMAAIFGIMFYKVPSSLVLYWLTNNIVSIVSMRMARI